MIKRVLALFLVLLTLVFSVPFTVFAEETSTGDVWVDLDKTTIKTDLGDYDFSKYKKDSSILNPSIITVAEKGFSANIDYTKCALYLYLHIPMIDDITLSSTLNKVQIKNGNTYSKYNLVYVAKEGEAVVKYKIDLPVSFFEQQNTKSRVYEIEAIEFQYKDSPVTPKDYKIGGKYTFEGTDESVALKSVETFEVVHLDIKYTTFRNTAGFDEMSAYYKNQLTSVYFSIPNYILEKYNYIYGIDCEYEKYYTKPIIVTNNKSLFDELEKVNGNSFTLSEDYVHLFPSYYGKDYYCYNSKLPVSLISYEDLSGGGVSQAVVYWFFNLDYSKFPYLPYFYDGCYESTNVPLYFYNPQKFDGDFWVSKDEVRERLESVFPTLDDDKHYLKSGLDYYHALLFEDYFLEIDSEDSTKINKILVDSKIKDDLTGKERLASKVVTRIDMEDDPYNMISYSENRPKWWQKLFDYGLKAFFVPLKNDVTFKDIPPIESIKSVDYKTLSDEVFSNTYYIDKNEISEVKANVALAELKDETTYIFRLDVAPYLAMPVSRQGEIINSYEKELIEDEFFMVQEPVYMGFDVLDLLFKDENGEIITVAVSSNPVNTVPGLDASTSDILEEDFKKWLDDLTKNIQKTFMLIMGIIALIIFVYICLKLFGFISNTAGNSIKTLTSSNSKKPKFKRRK